MNTPGNTARTGPIGSRRISVTSLVDLHELSGFSLTLVSTRGDAAAAAQWLTVTTGMPVNANVGAASQREAAHSVLSIGPGRWLVRAPASLMDKDAPAGTALFDISDAWRLFQISGIAARRLLASGCPLDFDPRRLSIRHCAVTRLDDFRVILSCTAPDTYEMYVERSYAEDLRTRIVLRAAGLTAPAELEA